MKVALYYPNLGIKGVDCRDISSGNPGIGGTHFAMLQIACLLTQYSSTFTIYLCAQSTKMLPAGLHIVETKRIDDVVSFIKEEKIDILILNKMGPESLTVKMLDKFKDCKIKIIIWGHCFIANSFLSYIANNNLIKRFVAVSQQQLFTLCDHKLYSKSTFIYNICNFHNPLPLISFEQRKKNVVFVGAINAVKGVHIITRAWPKVLEKHPDAQLFLIGGALYSKSSPLGKFGITECLYERKCLSPILKNGHIDNSVHFMGIMGKEKWEILNQCKVGIVNAAEWETFGYTMVEMQLAGLLVTSLKSPGLIDTMYKDNGILYDNQGDLAENIIKLLDKDDHDPNPGITYIDDNFSKERVVQKWMSLINDVYYDNAIAHVNINSSLKFVNLQQINLRIQQVIPFLPSLLMYRDLYSLYKRVVKAILDPRLILKRFKLRKL